MRTDFTEVRATLNAFLTTMEDTLGQLVSDANAQRRELLSLYQRMEDTRADMLELSDIADGAAMVLDGIFEVGHDITSKIALAIDSGREGVPSCNYEDFLDFCDGCGNPILKNEIFTVCDGEMYCPTCADALPDTDTDDQITIDDIDE